MNTHVDTVSRTRQVLKFLRAANLRVELRKCNFYLDVASSLGHVIGINDIATVPKMLLGIRKTEDNPSHTNLLSYWKGSINFLIRTNLFE